MDFNLDEAIKIANQVVLAKYKRNLTDVEVIILKGAWKREEYDRIAAQHQYATSYISQDAAPKFWKLLTNALGEKVKKSNFKEALRRCWKKQSTGNSFLPNHESINNENLHSSVEPKNLATTQYSNGDKQGSSIPSCYVECPTIESIFYETLLQPGSLIRLKAPRLMGKSSLVDRVLAQVANQNYQIANVSFENAFPQTHFTNLNRFLRWFCLSVSRDLGLPNQLDNYWDEEVIGAKVSCTAYLEEYLLTQLDNPLVLCFHDVDLLFPHPEVYEDFFGLLRSWYEKTRTRKLWKKLRLVLVHATEVSLHLKINQSPFNVGVSIELPEFNREQVQAFAQLHGLAEDAALGEKVNYLN